MSKIYFKELLGDLDSVPLSSSKSGPVFIYRGEYVSQITFYNSWTYQ